LYKQQSVEEIKNKELSRNISKTEDSKLKMDGIYFGSAILSKTEQ
jgi:hypothetical protein